MARAAALVNALADGIVTSLKLINAGPGANTWGAAADANAYLTKPKTVRRGMLVEVFTLPNDPALCVEVGAWKSTPEGGGGTHSLAVGINVHMKVSGNDAMENALNALAADVAYRLAQTETIAAIAEQVVQTGAITYEPQTDIMIGRGGIGLSTLTAEFELRYDHSLTTPP